MAENPEPPGTNETRLWLNEVEIAPVPEGSIDDESDTWPEKPVLFRPTMTFVEDPTETLGLLGETLTEKSPVTVIKTVAECTKLPLFPVRVMV